MKQLKRFLALVLVGVLALTVLTGCGSTNSTFGTETEKQMVAAINSVRSENTLPLTNDSTLRAKCAEALLKIDNEGKIYLKDTESSEVTRGDSSITVVVIMVATTPTYKQEYIKLHPNQKVNAMVVTPSDLVDVTPSIEDADDQEFYDSLEAFGVATRNIKGKTYIAMAMKVTKTKK